MKNKELKTLKDLEEGKYNFKGLVRIDHLKAEAVKWVKDAQDEMERLQERATKGLPINKLKIWENIGKSNVLMDFFNLTEEDLNEK